MKPPTLVLYCALLVACSWQSACNSTLDGYGVAKRYTLVDSVEEARGEQELAKKEFKDALTRFRELTGSKGDELDEVYADLAEDYEDCEYRAQKLNERIEDVEDVSQAVFDEWRDELSEYSTQELRGASEKQMRETERNCDKLIAAMKKAERTMQPVLGTFKDQVLYLQQNMNAQAISALQGQAAAVETDVAKLIADLEASIAEADKFIAGMPRG